MNFDLTPFGNANFAPFLTALATCAMLLLLIGYALTNREGLRRKAAITSAVGAVLSLCPLLLGIAYYSLLGGAITLCLALQTALLVCNGKTK
jgi:hypothetical protein